MSVPVSGSTPPPLPPRIRFPFGTDLRGKTATCPEDMHVRQLIEQVMLTSPGERVMRPTYGAALMQRVFEPGGPELLATTQYVVQATLSQELDERVIVESLEMESRDALLVVTVTWSLLRTGEAHTTEIVVPGGAA